jgi:hypothetical protein
MVEVDPSKMDSVKTPITVIREEVESNLDSLDYVEGRIVTATEVNSDGWDYTHW